MANETEVNSVTTYEGGSIIFAPDVVATISSLAAADVKGITSMTGTVVEGFTELLGKKSMTKGVKVELGKEEAAIDVSVGVDYGFKIHEVCQEVQKAVKGAVETMTGLRVVEVNVYVQTINFPESKIEKPVKKVQKEEKQEPRVK
ncbi:MAG: Asp23/Gls24 family envelope stress response protein [Clostridia bacterium]